MVSLAAFHLIVAALCMTLVATAVQGKPTTCAEALLRVRFGKFVNNERKLQMNLLFKDCCQVRNAIYECNWMALSTIQS